MPFGSLLVGPAGDVLAEDRNTVLSAHDVTAHPELKLARWAGRELTADDARATTMYTSCEPCPMCRGAIARSGLGRVVFALSGDQLRNSGRPARARRTLPRFATKGRRCRRGPGSDRGYYD